MKIFVCVIIFAGIVSCKNSAVSSNTQNELQTTIVVPSVMNKSKWLQELSAHCDAEPNSHLQNSPFFTYLVDFLESQGRSTVGLAGKVEKFLETYNTSRIEQLLAFNTHLLDKVGNDLIGVQGVFSGHHSHAIGYALKSSLKRDFYQYFDEEDFQEIIDTIDYARGLPSELSDETAEKYLRTLLALNYDLEYIVNQYLLIEYLLVSEKFSPTIVLEFLIRYLELNGFKYHGSIPVLERGEFLELIAKGNVWREDYSLASTEDYREIFETNPIVMGSSVLEALKAIYLAEGLENRQALRNIRHGRLSHLLQTYVQSRYLEDCGVEKELKKPQFLLFRKIPYLSSIKNPKVPDLGYYPWEVYWRSLNDGFARVPSFSSAHFNSMVVFLTAPELAKLQDVKP